MSRSPLRRLAKVATPPAGRLALATAAGAATVGCSLGLMTASGWLLARAGEQPELSVLAVAIVAVRAFGTARGFLRYGERLTAHDAALRSSARLRVRVFERLSARSPVGSRVASGDLLQRLVGDVEALQDLYLRGLHPVLVAAMSAMVAVTVATVVLPAAGLVLAVTLLVSGFAVPAVSALAGRRSGDALGRSRGRLADAVVDAVTGAPELVAWGAADRHLAVVADLEADVREAERRQSRIGALGDSLVVAVHAIGAVALIAVSTSAARGGQLDPVWVAALAFLALASFEIVAPLPAALVQLGALRGAAERISEVVDGPVAVLEPARPRRLPSGPPHLEVRGAAVSFDGGRSWALDGVDLDLVPARVVALVGESGAGKSTLAAALVRFVELDRGSITIGGVDVRDLPGDAVRSVVGLVEQRPHLFHASLRDNLRLARPDATDADLDAVARQAGLDHWVGTLPEGWDTDAGEAGEAMSGGERRRLALARALLADFDVLVLDEPTADVDREAAAVITTRLLDAARRSGQSVLLITHDTEGLDEVDEVVELDRGRVVSRTPGGLGVSGRR